MDYTIMDNDTGSMGRYPWYGECEGCDEFKELCNDTYCQECWGSIY